MGKTIYEQKDNTSVQKPIIQQFFTRKAPSQEEQQEMARQGYNWDGKNWRYSGTISDGGGKPSTDNRTAAERNKDYWSLSGATDRWNASWDNGTNPVKGALDNGLGYANPATATVNGVYDAYRAYNDLSSPYGLASTWGLIKAGEWKNAVLSGTGNVLSALDLAPGDIPGGRKLSRLFHSRTGRTRNSASRANTPTNTHVSEQIDNSPQVSPQVSQPENLLPQNTSTNSFNDRVQQLIDSTTGEYKQRLQNVLNGDVDSMDILYEPEYQDLIKYHNDYKYLNNNTDKEKIAQFIAIQKARKQYQDLGTYYDIDNLRKAFGTNMYDDNPFYQEIKPNLRSGVSLLPASTRAIFDTNQPWNPANNAIINSLRLSRGHFLTGNNHPYYGIVDRFNRNINLYGIPVEYAHIDPNVFDNSYPIDYFRGNHISPELIGVPEMVKRGLFGTNMGVFTDDQLRNLTDAEFDRYLRNSQNLGVSGSHGTEYWTDPTPKLALYYYINRNSPETKKDMIRLAHDMKNAFRAGYVNVPHSGEYSIDSWPMWERMSYKNRKNTMQLSNDRIMNYGNNTNPDKNNLLGVDLINGKLYANTNSLGLENRTEASPELLEFIKKNPTLKESDFTIIPEQGNISKVVYNGQVVGTIKMLEANEALTKFNEARKAIYKDDPSSYPGDAEILRDNLYFYRVPFVPTQIRKRGGKIYGKLKK